MILSMRALFSIFTVTIIGSGIANAHPLGIIVSGGFGTCDGVLPNKMASRWMQYAEAERANGNDVKFIVTCFSTLRPTEDFEYYSFNLAEPPGEKQVVRGGMGFVSRFERQFLSDYLSKELPPPTRILLIGQSHGGWVSLKIAASRRVEFLATFDPIDRAECTVGGILSLIGMAGLRNKRCRVAGSKELLTEVSERLVLHEAMALNFFQSASILHSQAISYPGFKNINFGEIKPEYRSPKGLQALNMKMHRALAVDPLAWQLPVGVPQNAHNTINKRDENCSSAWR